MRQPHYCRQIFTEHSIFSHRWYEGIWVFQRSMMTAGGRKHQRNGLTHRVHRTKKSQAANGRILNCFQAVSRHLPRLCWYWLLHRKVLRRGSWPWTDRSIPPLSKRRRGHSERYNTSQYRGYSSLLRHLRKCTVIRSWYSHRLNFQNHRMTDSVKKPICGRILFRLRCSADILSYYHPFIYYALLSRCVFLINTNLQSYLTFQCKCDRISTSKEITPENKLREIIFKNYFYLKEVNFFISGL